MIIVITGATGSGKTSLAIDLAKRIDGEIVNGDAFQVYKELNIATAKPSENVRKIVPHHLFDFVPINVDYDVYNYQQDSRAKIADILNRGKTPIIAGGTGLYIRASLYDYKFNSDLSFDMSEYNDYSNEKLHEILTEIDPIEASKIHQNNRIRVLRALEICFASGRTKSDLIKSQEHKPIYDCKFFGLKPERSSLYKSVEDRVDKMFDDGLVDENRRLVKEYGRTPHAFKAIGVKELFPYFDGEKTLEECKDEIKKATRHYIKRQDTFFAHQFDIEWIENSDDIISKL